MLDASADTFDDLTRALGSAHRHILARVGSAFADSPGGIDGMKRDQVGAGAAGVFCAGAGVELWAKAGAAAINPERKIVVTTNLMFMVAPDPKFYRLSRSLVAHIAYGLLADGPTVSS